MTENTKVTWWTRSEGYVRQDASPELQAFLNDPNGGYTDTLFAVGLGNIDGTPDDDGSGMTVVLYQHGITKELLVDLWNVNQGLAQLSVAGHDADAFMFTEYLRITQSARADRSLEDLHFIREAVMSFVRHGHGESTISEYGDTKEERANEREMNRAREQRRQAEKVRFGAAPVVGGTHRPDQQSGL